MGLTVGFVTNFCVRWTLIYGIFHTVIVQSVFRWRILNIRHLFSGLDVQEQLIYQRPYTLTSPYEVSGSGMHKWFFRWREKRQNVGIFEWKCGEILEGRFWRGNLKNSEDGNIKRNFVKMNTIRQKTKDTKILFMFNQEIFGNSRLFFVGTCNGYHNGYP